MKKLILLCSVLLSQSGFADALPEVKGKIYSTDCRTYVCKMAEIYFYFSRKDQQEEFLGARVYLLYGLDGFEVKYKNGELVREEFRWRDQNTLELTGNVEEGWSGLIHAVVSQRSSDVYVNGVDFIFKIVKSSGEEVFEKGSQSLLAYYLAAIPASHAGTCVVPTLPFKVSVVGNP